MDLSDIVTLSSVVAGAAYVIYNVGAFQAMLDISLDHHLNRDDARAAIKENFCTSVLGKVDYYILSAPGRELGLRNYCR